MKQTTFLLESTQVLKFQFILRHVKVSNLMIIEVPGSSETSVHLYQATRRHFPKCGPVIIVIVLRYDLSI